jgi:hypothetical protein
VSSNVPAVSDVFASPNKKMPSIFRADKLCRNNGVGMSEAIDLAVVEAEPPTAAKRKQSCYAKWVLLLLSF